LLSLADPADVHRTLGYLYRDRNRRAEAAQELELFLKRSKFVARDKVMTKEVQFELNRLR